MDRVYCIVCGSKATPGTRFCSSCGESLPDSPSRPEDRGEKTPVDALRRAWLIGSAPACGIVVSEATVSGRHCRLSKAGDQYTIEDLGSANGTWVSGRRINSPVRVQPHQTVTLGQGVSFPWDRILGLSGENKALEPPSPETTVIRVGRRPDTDVVLDYPMVSGYHAQIVVSNAGAVIEDLGSTNGTALNDVENKIQRAPLTTSDMVFFGAHRVPASRFLTTGPMTCLAAQTSQPEPGSAPAAEPTSLDLPVQPSEESSVPPIETAQWKPEFASILFTDIVDFTLLDPARQVQARQKLEQAVQDADAFRQARRENIIVARPTGDGVALVFFAHPSRAAECAVQIAKILENNSVLSLRMGIHQGTVYKMKDINGSEDVSGSGINMAQRVMDCGNAGHILVSASVAEALKGTMDWHQFVHAVGLRKIKHGDSIEIYNLRGPNFGSEVEPPSRS